MVISATCTFEIAKRGIRYITFGIKQIHNDEYTSVYKYPSIALLQLKIKKRIDVVHYRNIVDMSNPVDVFGCFPYVFLTKFPNKISPKSLPIVNSKQTPRFHNFIVYY